MNNQIDLTCSEKIWGMGILFYGMVWTLITFVLFVFPFDFEFIIRDYSIPFFDELFAITLIWQAGISGGLGGTIGLFRHMYDVTVEGKFEIDYSTVFSYLAYPMIGIVIGIISGTVMLVLIDTITQFSDRELLSHSTLVTLLSLVGFIAGSQQRAIFRGLGRLVGNFKPEVSQA